MLILFFIIWLPFSFFIGWLASKRGRSGMAWGFLSLLVSPVICLFALLLMSDLTAEAIRQAREESRYRDQLAVLSDIKAKMQTPDDAPKSPVKDTSYAGNEPKAVSRPSMTATAEQAPTVHQDKPQPGAVIEPAPIPAATEQATPVPAPPMAQDGLRSPSQSVASIAAYNSYSGVPAFKNKAFNPMLIAVGVLAVAVAVLVIYVFQLQKTQNQQQMPLSSTSTTQKVPLVTYKVEEFEDAKCLAQTCNRLVASVDGKRLVWPDEQFVTIEAQGDFNGDGIADALIHTNSGGNGTSGGNEYEFVSISDGKTVTAPVDIYYRDFEFMVEEGRTVVRTTLGSEIIFWGFDGQKAVKVRSVKLPLKTISSTVLCLQNKPKAACPTILDVIRDDRIFKDNFNLMLKKSPLSASDIDSFFDNGLTGGFELLKRNGKQYLRTDWYSKSVGPTIDLLIEITGGTSGSENRLTAIYRTGSGHGEARWLNDPTKVEKDILSNPVSDSKVAEPEPAKVESKAPSPVEPKRNVWFTPESGFTECIESRSGPADRIEGAKGKNPSVVEKDGGRIVQVTADYDPGRTVKWMFYRDKAECERVETNVEKKMADKYR